MYLFKLIIVCAKKHFHSSLCAKMLTTMVSCHIEKYFHSTALGIPPSQGTGVKLRESNLNLSASGLWPPPGATPRAPKEE
jgi:hypothetical protein